ncbi:NAD(P)-dependent oxidoreductase, partial [bacterium AH-315-I11]|nr:NAD(P)-dependent oxidoreductase [bacterium AH-315-I11]
MRILVTGGGGFIGQEIIKLLVKTGQHDVIAVDQSLTALENIQAKQGEQAKNIEIIEGNISQKDVLTQ